MFVSKKEVLFHRNIVWRAASVKHIFHPGMFYREDAVKKVWGQREKMSNRGREDEYFMQKTAEMIGAGYDILEIFGDPIHYPKKLLKSDRPPSNYERMSPHAFMAWVHSALSEKEILKVTSPRSR